MECSPPVVVEYVYPRMMYEQDSSYTHMSSSTRLKKRRPAILQASGVQWGEENVPIINLRLLVLNDLHRSWANLVHHSQ